MKKNIVNTPVFRMFVPIPYGILVYLLLLLINDNLSQLEYAFISEELIFCVGLSFIVFEANRLSLRFLANKSNFELSQLLIQVLISLVVTLLLVWGALAFYFIVVLKYDSLSAFQTEIKTFALIFGSTSVLYNILYLSHYFLSKRNDELFEQEQTLKDQLEYELTNYQAELKPKLFFESLESAIILLHENADDAEYFLDKLAMVYRYVLVNRDKEFVKIEDDIRASENLIYLLNIKYQNNISLEFENFPDDMLVLPGTITGLVEQIVSSTIITNNQPMVIKLYIEDQYLNIVHKLNQRLTEAGRNRETFYNLQDAYAYYTDNPVMKVQTYGETYYKIPLIAEKKAVA